MEGGTAVATSSSLTADNDFNLGYWSAPIQKTTKIKGYLGHDNRDSRLGKAIKAAARVLQRSWAKQNGRHTGIKKD